MQVYTSKQSAQQGMREEVETEKKNLIDQGYEDLFHSYSNNDHTILYVTCNDIYHEWMITPCELIGD
jgi:hypothetical protein